MAAPDTGDNAAAGFARGDMVELCGLAGRPELNGRQAVVSEGYNNTGGGGGGGGSSSSSGSAPGRIPVRLLAPTGGAVQLPGALLAIRPANLRKIGDEGSDGEDEGDNTTAGVEGALKEVLGEDVAAEIRQHVICTRCCAPCQGQCRVPHPPHLQVDGGSSFGFGSGGGAQFSFGCEACQQSYTVVSDDVSDLSKREIRHGPRWCFEGEHSMTALPDHDLRRVFKDLVTLEAGADLQAQLDELPSTHPDAKLLIVRSDGGYDDTNPVSLNVALPALEEVQLVDVAFSKIVLTEELTPKVRKLRMQNVPEDCDLDVRLPELEDLSIHYFSGDADAVQAMLDAATKLRSFESYKLWVGDELRFASNSLTDLRIHRSDALSSLSLWAPRLQSLNVQACYSLDDIEILESHELDSELPGSFVPTRFQVSALNANLSPELKAELRRHPRVVFGEDPDEPDDDDPFAGGGNPMEALFAQLQGMMANGWDGGMDPVPGEWGSSEEESEWETTDGEEGDDSDEEDDDTDEDDDEEYDDYSDPDEGVVIMDGGRAPVIPTVTITEITDEDGLD